MFAGRDIRNVTKRETFDAKRMIRWLNNHNINHVLRAEITSEEFYMQAHHTDPAIAYRHFIYFVSLYDTNSIVIFKMFRPDTTLVADRITKC